MPVETGDFDDLIVPLALVVASFHLEGNRGQIDYTYRHVQAVKSGDHEEAGAELRRAPRVLPRANAFQDKLRPFESLHTDESRAKAGGRQHQPEGFHAVAAIAVIDGERHRAAA